MAKQRVRRVAVVVGSMSDLPQCKAAFARLRQADKNGEIKLVSIDASSIHGNQSETLDLVDSWATSKTPPDVIIAGAGWAAHLPGIIDSRLRNVHKNTRIMVAAVAFDDMNSKEHWVRERHNMAAEYSITEVPRRTMVFEHAHESFIGAEGMLRAVEFAISSDLEPITLSTPKPPQSFTLDEAIAKADELIAAASA